MTLPILQQLVVLLLSKRDEIPWEVFPGGMWSHTVVVDTLLSEVGYKQLPVHVRSEPLVIERVLHLFDQLHAPEQRKIFWSTSSKTEITSSSLPPLPERMWRSQAR